ncbi:MAG: ATP-binding protein, partial [Gammaproteobacteria bacterium]|nr:ATP-binding protein [Gammaproteobacteria bacterium]
EAFTPQGASGQDVALSDGRLVSIITCPIGREPGQIVVIEDVTENRRLQERLNHFQRLSAIGEMAAQLAHQIRTPLASAMLYASQLAAGNLGTTGARAADKCLEQLHALNCVIRDMLLFARGTHDAENLEVEDLASEIRAKSERILQEAGCRLIVSDLAPHTVIRGSRSLLVGLFQNLISNGAQMCGQGGELHLRIEALGSGVVEFSVADNGPGIPDELKERIFEPFFTTRNQGTGLGLAIVRAIARDHRATIDVESSVGTGTVFTVRFPAVCQRRDLDMSPIVATKQPTNTPTDSQVPGAG